MDNAKIARIEWAPLIGRRPRHAGHNSRIGPHGIEVRAPVARVTTDDGTVGFGPARLTPDTATALVGRKLVDLFSPTTGVATNARPGVGTGFVGLEYPLWDLVARRAEKPVYALAAELVGTPVPSEPPQVRCYDTSLYIDDLGMPLEDEATALIASEAREGYERGHRAFKIKVGRGARYLPLDLGTRRDVAVIRRVREAVGPASAIMIDANNGYNLNLAKHVLAETADERVHWIEEPFHEDAALYRDLKEWLKREKLGVLIADGEGQAAPTLLDWAREGVVDVLQYDILNPGFTRWLEIGPKLDAWGTRSAPHHYGAFFGNFLSGHLAAPIKGFEFIEWDEATVPEVDTSRYVVRRGEVTLPTVPGFGLDLDETAFARAISEKGFAV